MEKPRFRNSLSSDHLTQINESGINPENLLAALGIEADLNFSNAREIRFPAPWRDEKEASVYINRQTCRWHDFGDLDKKGAALGLVQEIRGGNIYEVAKWVIRQGLCPDPRNGQSTLFALDKSKTKSHAPKEKGIEGENKIILWKYSLIPYTNLENPYFKNYGISPATAEYLGCGFLPAESTSSLKNRVVFRICDAQEGKRVLLGHVGRATSEAQAAEFGRWLPYKGFKRSFELYNQDNLQLDPEAMEQVSQHGISVVEGCSDVAVNVEAGIKNVVASLKGELSYTQAQKLIRLAKKLKAPRILIWFDRDIAGQKGAEKIKEQALLADFQGKIDFFDWGILFEKADGQKVGIEQKIQDPGNMSSRQLRYLRMKKII